VGSTTKRLALGRVVARYTGWASFRAADVVVVVAALLDATLAGVAFVLPDRWPGVALALVGWATSAGIGYAEAHPGVEEGVALIFRRPLSVPLVTSWGFVLALGATGGMVVGGLWAATAQRGD